MGWSSGVSIFTQVAGALSKVYGPDEDGKQQKVLESLICELEDGDCDTLDEGFDISLAGDKALQARGYHLWSENCEEEYDLKNQRYICNCGWGEK